MAASTLRMCRRRVSVCVSSVTSPQASSRVGVCVSTLTGVHLLRDAAPRSPRLQQEALEGEARADVLLQVAERVVGALQQARPAALGGRRLVDHATAQVELPA